MEKRVAIDLKYHRRIYLCQFYFHFYFPFLATLGITCVLCNTTESFTSKCSLLTHIYVYIDVYECALKQKYKRFVLQYQSVFICIQL